MKTSRAVISLGLVTLLYLGLLIWVDQKDDAFARLPEISRSLIYLIGFTSVSFVLRFIRWKWLLHRAGYQCRFARGFLAYVSGFTFTATPGKVGELVRIRYFEAMQIPRARVIAAFVYERVFDLIAVLLIASLAAAKFDYFLFAALFVLLIILIISFFVIKPYSFNSNHTNFSRKNFKGFFKVANILGEGINDFKTWLTPLDISTALFLGLLAWGITSLSFVWLLTVLNQPLSFFTAVAIYPLAMLVGAASMLPGGLGSTEAAIVGLLISCEVPFVIATLTAVTIRLSTLWFSVLCGLFAMLILEIEGKIKKTSERDKSGAPI